MSKFTKDMINKDKFLVLDNDIQRAYLILSLHANEFGIVNEPLGIIYKFFIDYESVEYLIDNKFISHDIERSVITFYNINSDYDG